MQLLTQHLVLGTTDVLEDDSKLLIQHGLTLTNLRAASSSTLLAEIFLVDFVTAFKDTISDGATVQRGFQHSDRPYPGRERLG